MPYSNYHSFLLSLSDNALIAGHRNSEWTGHGPMLEQDIALSNIALDLIGQARMLYQYTASAMGGGNTEDSLAYLRDAREFRNCLMVELPNGDWGRTILRQFFFSAYQYPLYEVLRSSADTQLAAIAEKSLKEVTYHLRWSSEWVIRLGDGTPESNERMKESLAYLWPFTGEMVTPASFESAPHDMQINLNYPLLESAFRQRVQAVLKEASLPAPDFSAWMQTGGKEGIHTEHLGFLLAEMQYLQRAYPGNEW